MNLEKPKLSRIDLNAGNRERILPQVLGLGHELFTMGDDDDVSDDGWLVACLKCISCFKTWVGVYPAEFDESFMECPRCGKMAGEKQPIEIEP